MSSMAIPYPKEDCLAVLLDSKARPSKHGVTFDKIEEQLRPSNPRFIQGVNNMLAGFRGFRPEITFKHRKEHGAIVFKSWGLKHIIVGAYGRLGVVEVYDDRYLKDHKLRRLARFDIRKDPQQRKALVMWLWTYSDARHRKHREALAAKAEVNPPPDFSTLSLGGPKNEQDSEMAEQ